MNTINRDKPKSKLKEFFTKDGIVAYLAIILTIYSLYKQWDSSNPKLTGGVRMVVKGTYIRTFVDDSPPEMRTAYTLYVQLTNTGKVPIDINYITIEALQEGEFHNLLIMLDPLSYLRMHQPPLVNDSLKFAANLFQNNTVIDPGRAISGFIICVANTMRWNEEYTKEFNVFVYDKLGNKHSLHSDMINGLDVLPAEVVEQRTGVRFINMQYKLKPDNNKYPDTN